MNPVIIEYANIGQVLFDPSKRARKLTVYIKSPERVRVAVPRGISFDRARQFVNLHAEWIKKQQHKMLLCQKLRHQLRPLQNIDYRQAAINLIERLNQLALTHSLPYKKVSIRNQRTRWGSCSAVNNISLNIQLAQLPGELIDYVLLHELTHTKVKSHSKVFWSKLSILCPQAKTLDKKLRQYSLSAPINF